MDSIGAPDMLAQESDRRLGHHERVSSVDPLLGVGRRMRSLATVADLEARRRDVGGRRRVVRRSRWVHHHRRVHSGEGPPLEE